MYLFFGWFDDHAWCGLAGWPAELHCHVVRQSCVEPLDAGDFFVQGCWRLVLLLGCLVCFAFLWGSGMVISKFFWNKVAGHRFQGLRRHQRYQSIPACAGEPAYLTSEELRNLVYVRVCGFWGGPLGALTVWCVSGVGFRGSVDSRVKGGSVLIVWCAVKMHGLKESAYGVGFGETAKYPPFLC